MANRDDERADGMLATVERARREKNYGLMESVISELGANGLLDDPRIRSRVLYERHMSFYQISLQSSGHPGLTQERLSDSLWFAHQSIEQADLAQDPVGRLYAEMNIAGLLLPGLGRWQEGMELSAQVCEKAEALAALANNEKAKARVLRVAANSYLHRIRITMEHNGDRADVARWLEAVKTNSVYVENKDEFGSLQHIEDYAAGK